MLEIRDNINAGYMKLKIKIAMSFIGLCFAIQTNSLAQTITNGSLEGGPTYGFGKVPPGWTMVYYTDPTCVATSSTKATIDYIENSWVDPNSSGVQGIAQDGIAFVTGLYAALNGGFYQEGMKQTVSGLTVGQSYTISFYQARVMQSVAQDHSGCWAVYADNTLIGISTATSSPYASYQETNLVWEMKTLLFTPTATSHVLKFLPYDDDASQAANFESVRMGLDNIVLTENTGLSVEMVSFSGRNEGDHNTLEWRTATESDNDYFAVERSLNAIDFTEIGRVDGAGTISTPVDYEFVDENCGSSVCYYRIKQVDFDGLYNYTKTISISKTQVDNTILTIYPNPADDYFNYEYSCNVPLKGELKIYDLAGRERQRLDINNSNGTHQAHVNIEGLEEGVYIVVINDNEGKLIAKKKLLKSK